MKQKPAIITTPISTLEEFAKAIGMSRKRALAIRAAHRKAKR